ncbi:hypothetical protein ACA910_011596 [Epithemia clementina (nom. ined.)]
MIRSSSSSNSSRGGDVHEESWSEFHSRHHSEEFRYSCQNERFLQHSAANGFFHLPPPPTSPRHSSSSSSSSTPKSPVTLSSWLALGGGRRRSNKKLQGQRKPPAAPSSRPLRHSLTIAA